MIGFIGGVCILYIIGKTIWDHYFE